MFSRDLVSPEEVFELVRHINDPEHPLTLEQLKVITVRNRFCVHLAAIKCRNCAMHEAYMKHAALHLNLDFSSKAEESVGKEIEQESFAWFKTRWINIEIVLYFCTLGPVSRFVKMLPMDFTEYCLLLHI